MLYTGLICGPLVARYGARLVAAGGVLLCVTSSMISSFVKSYILLFVFFGLIGGQWHIYHFNMVIKKNSGISELKCNKPLHSECIL